MSDRKYCPECNTPLNGYEKFCKNCGASFQDPDTDNSENNSGAIATNRETSGDDISRNNVMGNINKTTTNNTSNSLTNNKVDNSVSTVNTSSNVTNTSSSVDNSTVHNTTIVMGGKNEAEFCEVCGNPFEGKHARCPKCGKSICFDCKVKGKNRCVECEKKAINEYRMAYQELMLTTNGNIGAAGRQMMNRKAQELEVEDKKKSIEEEIDSMYKAEVKAKQPEVIAAAAATVSVAVATDRDKTQSAASKQQESKGVGALTDKSAGLKPYNVPKQSGSSGMWPLILSAVVAIVVIYLLFGGGDKQSTVAPLADEQNTIQSETAQPVQQAAQPAPVKQAEVQPAEVPEAAPVVKKNDVNYDAGMKAYEAGNGLEAVKKFKASGSADSYYMLGVIYESGCGSVGKNAMMARQNFKKAADMGHAEAKERL